jgi:hypothetical protein
MFIFLLSSIMYLYKIDTILPVDCALFFHSGTRSLGNYASSCFSCVQSICGYTIKASSSFQLLS